MQLAKIFTREKLTKLDFHKSPMKNVFTLGLAASLMAGCASVEIEPESTSFKTRITDSRLKHFEIQVKKDNTSLPTTLSNNSEVRRRQIQKLDPTRLQKQLVKAADYHIAETAFCRTGFWVIETNTYNPTMTLRAECNEQASDEDIANFPNTFQHW